MFLYLRNPVNLRNSVCLLIGGLLSAGCGQPATPAVPPSLDPNRASGEFGLGVGLPGSPPPVLVRSAYGDSGPGAANNGPTKPIALDVEIQMPQGSKSFDLSEIHLLDAETGQDYGGRPLTQRLTADGEPADNQDPIFAGTSNYRCWLVYSVPTACRAVKLGYRGRLLTSRPIVPERGLSVMPLIPQASVEPNAVIERSKVTDEFDSYLVLLTCQNWSRVQTPKRLLLRCLTQDKTVAAKVNSFVEIDRDRNVVSSDPLQQPHYSRYRYFVVDFWCPRGASVLDLEIDGAFQRLPAASEIKLPEATLAALAQTSSQEHARQHAP